MKITKLFLFGIFLLTSNSLFSATIECSTSFNKLETVVGSVNDTTFEFTYKNGIKSISVTIGDEEVENTRLVEKYYKKHYLMLKKCGQSKFIYFYPPRDVENHFLRLEQSASCEVEKQVGFSIIDASVNYSRFVLTVSTQDSSRGNILDAQIIEIRNKEEFLISDHLKKIQIYEQNHKKLRGCKSGENTTVAFPSPEEMRTFILMEEQERRNALQIKSNKKWVRKILTGVAFVIGTVIIAMFVGGLLKKDSHQLGL